MSAFYDRGNPCDTGNLKNSQNSFHSFQACFCDSYFSVPRTLHSIKKIEYDVIEMVKKISKAFFHYKAEIKLLNDKYVVYKCTCSTSADSISIELYS